MIIPQSISPEPNILITPLSIESIGSVLAQIGDDLSQEGSSTITQNAAWFVPFLVTQPCIALQMFVINGATANGTTHVGIYTEDGTRLVTTSATMLGTSAIQTFDIDDTLLSPGTYYMAFASSSASAAFRRVTTGAAAVSRMLGCFAQASAVPLPAIATFAAFAEVQIPLFGVALTTTY